MARKAQLRLAVRHGDKCGLVWQATLHGHDVYADTPHPAVSSRFSYHKSGAGHVHILQRRIIFPPSQPTEHLLGKQKVGGWSYQFVQWGYHIRPDTSHRRTAILEEPIPRPVSIELWLLQRDHPELAQEVLTGYQGVRVIAQLHIPITSPQLFAVVYTMTGPVVEALLHATEHERQRRYLS